ncbi:calcium-binding protein [Yoonia sp.]|uniref:calcium-binding protein n=1 Tax=Yoonia sp. TaxID=2212373 RepID=UPI0039757980
MDITVLLLLAASGALLIPLLAGDDDDDRDDGEIRGTFEDDEIEGTEGDDVILGFLGNDTINAGAGQDAVIGGEGNDVINGGDNRDILEGRAGNDTINGDDGNDTILGGAGDDMLDGGYGSDIMRGGRGDDLIYGGFDARLIDGELVNAVDRTDTLRGEGGEDTIYIWGGGGFAAGGVDDNDNDIADEKDTLVLVTGTATLSDDAGSTDFYALANIEDDVETFAIIDEFDNGNPLDADDRGEHRLILTVDIDLGDSDVVPQVGFEAATGSIEENGETVNGIFISAKLLNPEDFPDSEFEEAAAFFRGETNPTQEDLQTFIENNYQIEVVYTDAADNDYFMPQNTVAAIAAQVGPHPNLLS